MSDKRVTPVRPVGAINPIKPAGIRRTYFRQLQQWRTMSEKYAKARKAREATGGSDDQEK